MDLGLAQEPVEGMEVEVEDQVVEEEGLRTTTAMKSELSVYL